jgi:hypothetical protein
MEAMERVTPMAIGIMVETRETTPTVTTMKAMVTRMEAMDIRMEAMDNTVLRRICRISSVIIARSQDILLICAQRRN